MLTEVMQSLFAFGLRLPTAFITLTLLGVLLAPRWRVNRAGVDACFRLFPVRRPDPGALLLSCGLLLIGCGAQTSAPPEPTPASAPRSTTRPEMWRKDRASVAPAEPRKSNSPSQPEKIATTEPAEARPRGKSRMFPFDAPRDISLDDKPSNSERPAQGPGISFPPAEPVAESR